MPEPVLSVVALPLAAAPAVQDRYFDSAGVRLRYVEAGEGEPVILLHGYTSDLEAQWVDSGVFSRLARRHRVIAFDARGHGRSGRPYEPQAYGAEMGRDVVRLLDHLGLARAHIVGYSMGAHIVAQLLTVHPERFVTAALGGATGRRNWTPADDRRVEIEAAEMEQGSLATQLLRLWPEHQPQPSAHVLAALSADLLKGQDPRALAALRRSNRAQAVTDEQLASVRVPVLGIVGSVDGYLADFHTLRALVPRMRFAVIDGATHGEVPHRPEFVRTLEAFLHEHPALDVSGRSCEHRPAVGHADPAQLVA
jgi:pimeloyl-ACP methyl ester carboxylesterase